MPNLSTLYGLEPRGCVRDLADPAERAPLIASGDLWDIPLPAAQWAAAEDIAAGSVPMPDYDLPEWVVNVVRTRREEAGAS